jgi:hypothetical protein
MGLLDGLKRLFGGGTAAPADRGMYYYVRCDRCREAIRVRVDPAWDLAPDFEGGGGFGVTKHVIGQKCFRPIEVTITFDEKRQEIDKEISGGKFITAEEYEAEQAPKQASAEDGPRAT